MNYIRISTQEFPLHEGDIRLEFPNMGEEFVLPPDFAEVAVDPFPEFDPLTERPSSLAPKKINGAWRQRWAIVEPTLIQKIQYDHSEITPENQTLDSLKYMVTAKKLGATGDALAAWEEYEVKLFEYIDSYPRSGRIPAPPLFDEAGNPVTNSNPGSTPNVIG